MLRWKSSVELDLNQRVLAGCHLVKSEKKSSAPRLTILRVLEVPKSSQNQPFLGLQTLPKFNPKITTFNIFGHKNLFFLKFSSKTSQKPWNPSSNSPQRARIQHFWLSLVYNVMNHALKLFFYVSYE